MTGPKIDNRNLFVSTDTWVAVFHGSISHQIDVSGKRNDMSAFVLMHVLELRQGQPSTFLILPRA